MKKTALLFLIFLVMASIGQAQAKSATKPYLGQNPPGNSPVIFAPGIISKGNIHSRLVIAPDESYLLFTSNRPLISDKEDMYIQISFRSGEGTWSTPRKLFEIEGRFPSLSPDGKILFFCGDDGNIYWVDQKIIEPLRPASLSPVIK